MNKKGLQGKTRRITVCATRKQRIQKEKYGSLHVVMLKITRTIYKNILIMRIRGPRKEEVIRSTGLAVLL
jgi:hypothetical protein